MLRLIFWKISLAQWWADAPDTRKTPTLAGIGDFAA
jgi:hypothetical protein